MSRYAKSQDAPSLNERTTKIATETMIGKSIRTPTASVADIAPHALLEASSVR